MNVLDSDGLKAFPAVFPFYMCLFILLVQFLEAAAFKNFFLGHPFEGGFCVFHITGQCDYHVLFSS